MRGEFSVVFDADRFFYFSPESFSQTIYGRLVQNDILIGTIEEVSFEGEPKRRTVVENPVLYTIKYTVKDKEKQEQAIFESLMYHNAFVVRSHIDEKS